MGRFKPAAAEFARRAVSLPEAAYAAIAFLSDTMDWLNPWHHDAVSCGEVNEDTYHAEQNRLFSHMEP